MAGQKSIIWMVMVAPAEGERRGGGVNVDGWEDDGEGEEDG